MQMVTAQETADAIGQDAVSFRAILRRYKGQGVGPAIDPGRGNWRFSAADVATFAVCRAMMNFGVFAVDAFKFAKQAMGKLWGTDASAEQVVRQLNGKHLEVTYGDKLDCRVVSKRRALPVVLYIDLAHVVVQAFARLRAVAVEPLSPTYYVAEQRKLPSSRK